LGCCLLSDYRTDVVWCVGLLSVVITGQMLSGVLGCCLLCLEDRCCLVCCLL
jgi:hypothetical protein